MWKKEEETSGGQAPAGTPSTAPTRRSSTGRAEPATIGPSITIKGEVSGDEDLLIQGRIDGSVDLQDQAVTVGSEGRVKADIKGRIVTVEGEVEGDLHADEQVILRSSAKVEGDITAPRVVLEDGARFRGLVDMGESAKGKDRSSRDRPSSSSSSSSSSASSSSGSGSSGASGSSGSASSGSSSSSAASAKKDADSSDKTDKADKAKAAS